MRPFYFRTLNGNSAAVGDRRHGRYIDDDGGGGYEYIYSTLLAYVAVPIWKYLWAGEMGHGWAGEQRGKKGAGLHLS